MTVGKCPKCGWTTRELFGDEITWLNEGRMRCSGKCLEGSVPNQPVSWPPVLKEFEQKEEDKTNGSN